ncbi:MAG: DUF501 domain-containing protein [Acidimicrobiia bacterium]|nr:DUF501 domain-containing protein [Acidimicrobiia bacterium]
MSSKDDDSVVAAQLDRELRSSVEVVSRCHLDLPVVVGVPPILDDGTPFPTRWWLTCPLSRLRIDRLESAGGVSAMDRYLKDRPDWQERMEQAHDRYATERDSLIDNATEPRPSGGIAGTAGDGVKCLHAHYADSRIGHDNPVGESVAPFVEPLNCTRPCVVVVDGEAVRNPEWIEPR